MIKKIYIPLALIGLILSIASPILTFLDIISASLNRPLLVIGMLAWFAGAIPWLGREPLKVADTEVEI